MSVSTRFSKLVIYSAIANSVILPSLVFDSKYQVFFVFSLVFAIVCFLTISKLRIPSEQIDFSKLKILLFCGFLILFGVLIRIILL